MAKQIEHEVEYHYDLYPTKEDLMGETPVHADLVDYLMDVLRWSFREQVCAVYENFNFYQTPDPDEYPLAPDIAVIKGVERQADIRSWKVWQTGIAPQVVFEVASRETWKTDLEEKPARYALMGVHEYFAYDPNQPPLRRKALRRLFGWQLDLTNREMRQMPVSPEGRLWSVHLDSWLAPDGPYLRLYDRNGQLRLTRAEAEAKRADAEAEARRAEAQRVALMAEKLRSLGIDPDQL